MFYRILNNRFLYLAISLFLLVFVFLVFFILLIVTHIKSCIYLVVNDLFYELVVIHFSFLFILLFFFPETGDEPSALIVKGGKIS